MGCYKATENLGEHGRSTQQNSTRTRPQTLSIGCCSLVWARQVDVKSGQVTVIASKDVPFEDQTAAWCLHGADSEHIQISSLENSPRTCLGARNAIILLNYLYAWQLSKSNPPHRVSICPHCRYLKALAYCRLWRTIPRAPKYFHPLQHQLDISTTLQSKLFKEKALFMKNRSQWHYIKIHQT